MVSTAVAGLKQRQAECGYEVNPCWEVVAGGLLPTLPGLSIETSLLHLVSERPMGRHCGSGGLRDMGVHPWQLSQGPSGSHFARWLLATLGA